MRRHYQTLEASQPRDIHQSLEVDNFKDYSTTSAWGNPYVTVMQHEMTTLPSIMYSYK